ncbi:MAG: YqgE/AlgH family protein [Alphaproteobacteria bacterium]
MTIKEATNLQGKIIAAMPQMNDSYFARSVIYICYHDDESVMGLILNKPVETITFADIVDKIELDEPVLYKPQGFSQLIRNGGPVETSQGFILHSAYVPSKSPSSPIADNVYLSTHIDTIHDIATHNGPKYYISFLGYTGWGQGQLEQEILQNQWFHCDINTQTLWKHPTDDLWSFCLKQIGLNEGQLSSLSGHA